MLHPIARLLRRTSWIILVLALLCRQGSLLGQAPAAAWSGVLQMRGGEPLGSAKITLAAEGKENQAAPSADGSFAFPTLLPKTYALTVERNGRLYRSAAAIKVPAQAAVVLTLEADGSVFVGVAQEKAAIHREERRLDYTSE